MSETLMLQDVVIVAGARTAIGGFGGSLAAYTPAELGTFAGRAAIERAGVDAGEITPCLDISSQRARRMPTCRVILRATVVCRTARLH